ncbi:MAG: helix-turn-helix domain-containing protein [Spirochaetota bacterium]
MMTLFFFHGYALFISNAIEPDFHQHHLMELFISLDKPLTIKMSKEFYKAKNFIIESDELHRIESNSTAYAVILLDSESKIAQQFRKIFLYKKEISILSDSLLSLYLEDIKMLFNNDCKIERAKIICDNIIAHIIGEESIEISIIDHRIEKILNMFTLFPDKKVKIKELSERVDLSESRLIHLFTKQVGIPIRHYLLWLRLIDAIKLIVKGSSFTDAAYEAGFSDSAHLSRTFKKMFGLKLLEVFKNYKDSGFVQVITE